MSGGVVSAGPRVGWVLTGDRQLASSRLQGLCIHEFLRSRQWPSEVVAINAGALAKGYSQAFAALALRLLGLPLDCVVFQKPDWMMFKLSEMARLNGLCTVAVQCDPFPGDYGSHFDHVIVTSPALREVLRVPAADVIDDLLEVPPDVVKRDYSAAGRKLRLVWVGQSQSQHVPRFLAELAAHPALAGNVEAVTIGSAVWATRPWTLESVHRDIIEGDIALLPLPETEASSTKSTNRLTQFMALGLPTIATPIDSYRRLFDAGAPFHLAHSLEEFVLVIQALRDESARRVLGQAAREYAWQHFAPEVVAPGWMASLRRAIAGPRLAPATRLHTRVLGRSLGRLARLFPQRTGAAPWDGRARLPRTGP